MADFPRAYQFLFQAARYKVRYGGRGGGGSWSFASALLMQGAATPLRIVCARETQQSISDSVHQLLDDRIKALNLRSVYEVQQSTILGKNGTEFIFAGLRHNIDNIKSLEGADRVWVEEAANVSCESWEKLIPTMRKDGSEIWVSFNPELESDDTYQRFVLKPPPAMIDGKPYAVIRKINYDDNPFFPDVLRVEMEQCRIDKPDAYSNIWLGNCKRMLEGAIYAAELRAAETEQRITRIPYDRSRPVNAYWDLGYGDTNAIWLVQSYPFEHRLIDYMEDSARSIHWWIKKLQDRGYIYGEHWLPWDIGMHANTQLGTGKSIEETMRLAGLKVRISKKLDTIHQINAARTVFPICYFDGERCKEGLQALRHYRMPEKAASGAEARKPVHDWASHGSSAYNYFAIASRHPDDHRKEPESRGEREEYSWQG